MYLFISIVMIAVTLLFAVASAFIFRSHSNAERARITSAGVHLALFEGICVAIFEICRWIYSMYIEIGYAAFNINLDVFGAIHMIICSVCTVAVVVCVMTALRQGLIWRAVTVGAAVAVSAAAAAAGYYVLRAIEQIEVAVPEDSIVKVPVTDEYSTIALPVSVLAVFVIMFTAANILLDTKSKWSSATMVVMSVANLIVYAGAFIIALGFIGEISEELGESAVYAVAILGIIIALPPIICMCSVFAEKIAKANEAAKKKAERRALKKQNK